MSGAPAVQVANGHLSLEPMGGIDLDGAVINQDAWEWRSPIDPETRWYMDVSENSGTPKSSILIGFSIINHPFRGTLIFGSTHMSKGERTPFLSKEI